MYFKKKSLNMLQARGFILKSISKKVETSQLFGIFTSQSSPYRGRKKKKNDKKYFALISWVFIRWSSYLLGEYVTYGGFIGYSEISNFNPQTRYYDKKVNFQLFKKCYFGGCDVENWVWTKLPLWICPISWIRIKIGYAQLSLTFFY